MVPIYSWHVGTRVVSLRQLETREEFTRSGIKTSKPCFSGVAWPLPLLPAAGSVREAGAPLHRRVRVRVLPLTICVHG